MTTLPPHEPHAPSAEPQPPGSGPRILRRQDLGRLRDADDILRDAEATRRASEIEARRIEQTAVDEARQEAVRESARTAASLIAQAEAAAERRIRNLEPELARIVADTVRGILGAFEPEEATYRAALTALAQLRDHRRGRIFAAPDVATPVARAVAELSSNGPEILGVHTDPALDPGRAVLTSDHGSAEIGLKAQIDQALRPWEGGGALAEEAEPEEAGGEAGRNDAPLATLLPDRSDGPADEPAAPDASLAATGDFPDAPLQRGEDRR